MDVRPLEITGAWVFTPRQFADDRGVFCEWFKANELVGAAGHPLNLAQANNSVSRRGTLRGIHYSDVPPGQAKYVYCPSGAVMDVVVDIRAGSQTFGRWEAVRLDDVDRRGVYISEGLGHAFIALTDGACVTYLVSTPYNPTAEHGILPTDPDLDIAWDEVFGGPVEPLLSPKDAEAPTLAEALAAGALPTITACEDHYRRLREAAGGQ